jgi:hypothetical protein
MSEFERQQPTVRLAEIHYSDTLQRIAAREMGDANKWPDLVWINSLSPPYLAQNSAAGVLAFGGVIKIPAPVGVFTDAANNGQAYERDCAMIGKLLSDDGAGDLLVFSGLDNLKQQLSHAINTPRGQATRNPNYGCMVWSLLGSINGPTAAKLGSEYVKSTLLSDYRVSGVISSVADVMGDAIKITARAIAIDGSAVDLNFGAAQGSTGGAGYGNNYGNNWG